MTDKHDELKRLLEEKRHLIPKPNFIPLEEWDWEEDESYKDEGDTHDR